MTPGKMHANLHVGYNYTTADHIHTHTQCKEKEICAPRINIYEEVSNNKLSVQYTDDKMDAIIIACIIHVHVGLTVFNIFTIHAGGRPKIFHRLNISCAYLYMFAFLC